MSEDTPLEENFETANARITPGVTIGGMGEVSLPNAKNGNIGSGDVPDIADIDDDEEEAKKDKTKKKLEMEGFKLFTQFNNFITESLSEGASNFKFGIKKQYSADDINQMYGFWGTLDVHMDSESIEEIWNDVWGILTKSWKFSDAGALYYLNAKAGRWLADKVWNDINSQISQPDAIDMILSDYVRPSQWKAWAKEYNEFAQEELAESLSEGASNFKVLLKTAKDEPIGRKIRLGDKRSPGHEIWEKVDKMHWMNLKTEETLDLNKWAKHADKFNMEGKDLQFENFMNEAFDDIADLVKSLHFETDPKIAKEKKIELGKRQGEVVPRTQIEGGNYSLRRFRKEIKYDETGEDVGVFKPGSYMAATSKLGDGPHKKEAAKAKRRWNQKQYDKWIEDVASNGGWEHAFDMAQNAKHEPGLLQWAKKEFRGEDPMQRIQWDIEAYAESVVTEGTLKISGDAYDLWDDEEVQRELRDVKIKIVGNIGGVATIKGSDDELQKVKDILGLNESVVTEKLARGLKPLLTLGSTITKKVGEDALLDLSDKFDRIDDEYAGTIASWLDMAIELMQDGYAGDATKKLKQFNKACKDVLNGKDIGSAFESVTKDYFSEFCKLNEAKSINRDEMMDWIGKYMEFVGTSEEFNGSEGGIHVSGEDGAEYKGNEIYSYYSEDYKNREFGVWNKWEKELNKRGWYSEWYDAGTVCIWPL